MLLQSTARGRRCRSWKTSVLSDLITTALQGWEMNVLTENLTVTWKFTVGRPWDEQMEIQTETACVIIFARFSSLSVIVLIQYHTSYRRILNYILLISGSHRACSLVSVSLSYDVGLFGITFGDFKFSESTRLHFFWFPTETRSVRKLLYLWSSKVFRFTELWKKLTFALTFCYFGEIGETMNCDAESVY